MGEAVLHIDDANFEQAVLNSDKPVFVDFWAEWCGPCRRIAPFIEEIGKDFEGRAVVAKVDVDKSPQTAGRYGITSIPTLVLFKGGEPVDAIMGAVPKDQMSRMIEKHL